MDFRLWKRKVKFFWQRLTRGWDDSVTWNLDWQIATFVLPRLRRFREVTIAYPPEITFEEWQSIIDKMIFALEWHSKDTIDRDIEDYSKVQEGMELFGKYFGGLWW